MYAFLEGILSGRSPESTPDSRVVIQVGGIGFEVHVGERQRLALPAPGELVRLYTHLVVREDDHALYGFSSAEEREVFRALLSVNGVGPKAALGVLGSQNADAVLRGIRAGDHRPLLAVKGIGKKTAERVVLELEDKAATWVLVDSSGSTTLVQAQGSRASGPAAEAILALQSLGVGPDRAAQAVAAVSAEGPIVSVEQLLRSALRELHPESRS